MELPVFDRGSTAELIRTVKAHGASNLSVETVDQVFTDSGGNPLFVLEIAHRCLKLFAYSEAAALAERGMQHCRSLDPQTQIRLQLGLLRVWALAGVTPDRATQLEAEIQQCMAQANRLGSKEDEAIGLEALTILHFNQNKFADFHQHSLQAAEISCKASPATAARLLAFSASCLFELGRDMERAEALLLEAQSLAARVDLQITDLYAGLACVHYHKGCYAEARVLMERAWQQAQAEQDHWRECIDVSYLAMLELEVGDPAAALPYCEEMAIVAAKIQGEGSEGAIAAALKALANYKLQKTGAEVELQQAITTLRQIDAKRMLSCVLNVAAEADLAAQRLELAVVRAEAALEVAQIKNHASETASAWAILIYSLVGLGDWKQATAQFEALHPHIDRRELSAHAQRWFDRTIQLMQNR